MAAFDPGAVPFWEKQRGGGPITDWQKSRDELEEREQDRKLRLLDPRCVVESHPRNGRPIDYAARRALGLCGSCSSPSPDASRCTACAERYHNNRIKMDLSYAERRALGLCQSCNKKSETARCYDCAEQYKANRLGRQVQYKRAKG